MNLENVQCEICGNTKESGFAMARLDNMWQCGECIIKFQEKIKKFKKKLMLEE